MYGKRVIYALIASVSQYGTVKALSEGVTAITVRSDIDPSLAAVCHVLVLADESVLYETVAISDAHVSGGTRNNTNHRTATELNVKCSADRSNSKDGSGYYDWKAYFKFDISDSTVDPNGRVIWKIYVSKMNGSAARDVFVYACDNDWTEDAVTWVTAPAETELIATMNIPFSSTGKWVEFDVTDYVKKAKADGLDAITLSADVDRTIFNDITGFVVYTKEYGDGSYASKLTFTKNNLSILPVKVDTTAGVAPQMPATVTAILANGEEMSLPVVWDEIESALYLQEGTFTVAGTVTGELFQGARVIATVSVGASRMAVTSVTVTTPTIVETLAANLKIYAEGENLDGRELIAYLSVDGNLSCETPVVNGEAFMKIDAAPAADSVCKVIVKVAGTDVQKDYLMNIAAYDADLLWRPQAGYESGTLTVTFGSTIGTNKGYTAKSGTTNYNASQEGGHTLLVSIPESEAVSGTPIAVGGVKYPDLFPSYSFTFTVYVP